LAVELFLLPAAECFLLVLQQVAAEMAVGMAAKKETDQETHLQLRAVVGMD
jgi:organic hydroperoxide reductase OsmC/OhrA